MYCQKFNLKYFYSFKKVNKINNEHENYSELKSFIKDSSGIIFVYFLIINQIQII
jgi:hypothetical protein